MLQRRRHFLPAVTLIMSLAACAGSTQVIGYLPTDPVSIPTTEKTFRSLRLDAKAVADSIVLPGAVVHEFQATVERALSSASRSTFPAVGFDPHDRAEHELRLLKLDMDRVLVQYNAHSKLEASPFSFGPRFSSSTSEHSIHVLETRYKAVLSTEGHIIGVYEATLSTQKTNDMRKDLTVALERMAEEINTGVVRTLIGTSEGCSHYHR